MSHRILNVNVSLQSINQPQLCEQMLDAMTQDDRDSLQIVTSTQKISISSKLLQIFSPLYRDILRDIPIKDSEPVTMMLPDTEGIHVQHLLDLLTSGKVHDNHLASGSAWDILTLAECFKIEIRGMDLTPNFQDKDKISPPKIRVKNIRELSSPDPIPCESININNEKANNPASHNFENLININDEEDLRRICLESIGGDRTSLKNLEKQHREEEFNVPIAINIDKEEVANVKSLYVKCSFCRKEIHKDKIKDHEEEDCHVRKGRSIFFSRFYPLIHVDDKKKLKNCSLCQKEIAKSDLKNHEKICRVRRKGICQFECYTCGKNFSTEQGRSDPIIGRGNISGESATQELCDN